MRKLKPHDCEACDCEQFQWNGMSWALKVDPPSTCECGHLASQHWFISRDERAAVTSGGAS